jgi:stress-induced morphogen
MNREERILNLLRSLQPTVLKLDNDSHKHANHVEHLGSAGFTGETHYKLLIVAEIFAALSRIERQRKINELLKDEFATGLHAFEMKIYSPAEFEKN